MVHNDAIRYYFLAYVLFLALSWLTLLYGQTIRNLDRSTAAGAAATATAMLLPLLERRCLREDGSRTSGATTSTSVATLAGREYGFEARSTVPSFG